MKFKVSNMKLMAMLSTGLLSSLILSQSAAFARKVYYGPGSTGAKPPLSQRLVPPPTASGRLPGEPALRYLDRLIRSGNAPGGNSLVTFRGLQDINSLLIEAINGIGGSGRVSANLINDGYIHGLPFATAVGLAPDRKTVLSQIIITAGLPGKNGVRFTYAILRKGSTRIITGGSGRTRIFNNGNGTLSLDVDQMLFFDVKRNIALQVTGWRRVR